MVIIPPGAPAPAGRVPEGPAGHADRTVKTQQNSSIHSITLIALVTL